MQTFIEKTYLRMKGKIAIAKMNVVDLNLKLKLLSYRLPGVENFSLAVMTLLLCH